MGFIRFDQRFEAEQTIKMLNGTIPDGATEPITVKFANSPSSTKASLIPTAGAAASTVTAAAAMASYLTAPTATPTTQTARRFLGPIHHPASRFR